MRESVHEIYEDDEHRNVLTDGNNVFCGLAKTLRSGGIIRETLDYVCAEQLNKKIDSESHEKGSH